MSYPPGVALRFATLEIRGGPDPGLLEVGMRGAYRVDMARRITPVVETRLAAADSHWLAGDRANTAILVGQAIPAKSMIAVAYRVGETTHASASTLGMAIVESAEWHRNMRRGNPTPSDILRGYLA